MPNGLASETFRSAAFESPDSLARTGSVPLVNIHDLSAPCVRHPTTCTSEKFGAGPPDPSFSTTKMLASTLRVGAELGGASGKSARCQQEAHDVHVNVVGQSHLARRVASGSAFS